MFDVFRKEMKLWGLVAACAIILCFGMTCTVAAYRLVGIALVSNGNAPLTVQAETYWQTIRGPIKVTVSSNQQVGESTEVVIDRAMKAAEVIESTQ